MGNLLISAAILYSGSLPAKALRVFDILKCSTISRKTFFRQQSRYLQPAIKLTWEQYQNELLRILKEEHRGLVFAGDGRADNPAHSAKYGTYSMIELVHNKKVDFKIVPVLFM